MLGATGLFYSIPSIALFVLLIPITGLSLLTAEIALVGYAMVILVRNIVTALRSVPPEVLEAADGMGYRVAAALASGGADRGADHRGRASDRCRNHHGPGRLPR